MNAADQTTIDDELSDSQEQILDAAMACITREGIDGTSMRRVADEADVSLGLLSYHFDGKQDLIVSAFQLACDRLLDVAFEAVDEAGSDAEARLVAFVRSSFHGDFLEYDYLTLRITLWAMARTDPAIAEAERSLYNRYWEQLVELARASDPQLADQQAADRATDIVVTQNGLWLNWARYQDERDLQRGLDRCERIALGQG